MEKILYLKLIGADNKKIDVNILVDSDFDSYQITNLKDELGYSDYKIINWKFIHTYFYNKKNK